MPKAVRQPIVVLVGHIDHGKSSILETIKGVSILKKEAGGITQTIKSYTTPLPVIKKICGGLLDKFKIKLTIPGLLFLDSPGHAAFNNLRKRGGNLADIAILVIDVNEGIKPQTLECIDILKNYKTPFIIAANKIDLIPGWIQHKGFLLENIEKQTDGIKTLLDRKIYEIVGKLHELGFPSERFDRVENYTKQIAIIPSSARSGEGIPELVMVLAGLAQRYLEKTLKYDISGPGKGVVLEVMEEKGLGITLDVILYDGSLKQNDTIVIGGLIKPTTTKVRALFEPFKNKYKPVRNIHAAAGVKISASGIGDVVPGMPLKVADKNIEEIKKEIQKEVEEVLIETDKEGIIVKADSLGSLEALINLLKENNITIKRASIGNITKKDIADASAEKNLLNKVILGFNVQCKETTNIKVILHDVIYRLIEDLESWRKEEGKKLEAKELEKIIRPCKVRIIPNCIFRQSNPAVVGVDVQAGTLRVGIPLMKENGNKASEVKSMQLEGKNIQEAKSGKQVAIAIPRLIVGRQINENDILYSDIPEKDFVKLKKLKKYLNREEIEILKEIAEIKRKENPVWGV